MRLAARVRWIGLAVGIAVVIATIARVQSMAGANPVGTGVGERIRAVEATFAAIRAHRSYRHWTGVDETMALAQAQFAPAGPLTGLVVGVKDNIDLSWLPTAAGVEALRDRRPIRNATVVDRLLDAGAVVAGHTNMDTWARGVRTVSETTGSTANAWNPSLGPMGSSGGSAVAVALGEIGGALGTDTCGSLRYPAAANVIHALRPTPGLVSRAGVVPLAPTQDVVGPMARDVRTLARLLDAIDGPDPRDPLTIGVPRPERTYTELLGDETRTAIGADRMYRVGIIRTLGSFRNDAMNDSMIDKMRRVRIELVEVAMPSAPFSSVINDESAATRPLVLAGADESRWLSRPLRPPGSSAYASRLRDRTVAAGRLTALLDGEDLDAIAYPTTPYAPALRGAPQRSANCRYSATSGLPALSLGHGFDAAGTPVPGIDLLGRAFDEATLLRIGLHITEV